MCQVGLQTMLELQVRFNEACKLGLIKRSSPSTAMFLLLCAISISDDWDSVCCLDGEGAISVRPPLTTKGWGTLQTFGRQGSRINRAACRTFDFLSLWLPTRSGALWSWLSWLKERGKQRANSKNVLETVFLDATLAWVLKNLCSSRRSPLTPIKSTRPNTFCEAAVCTPFLKLHDFYFINVTWLEEGARLPGWR